MKKTAYILLILCIMSCNTSVPVRYEGFTDSILTVYVIEYIPQNESDIPERIESILTKQSNYRAFRIMACYVSIHLDKSKVSTAADELLNRTVNEIISSGKIIYSNCNDENYCEAGMEYNAEKLFQAVDSINNQLLYDQPSK